MKCNEHIKELIKLSEENPELEIKCKVRNEGCNEDYCWTMANISDPEICDYLDDDGEYIHLDDEIEDVLSDRFYEKMRDMTQEEEKEFIDNKITEMKLEGIIKTAIFISVSC